MFVPRLWRPALLLGLAVLWFVPMLGARDIVTSHEARVAQTGRRMAASGWPWDARPASVPVVELKDESGSLRLGRAHGAGYFDVNPWFVPVLNGEIRLQKPPLPYWGSAVMFKWFGFGERAARLPPALMGAAAVLLVYDLGRRLIGRLGGWLAGIVWVSSYFVFDEYRKVMADPYLAFFSLLAIWAWVRAAEGWRRRRDDGGPASLDDGMPRAVPRHDATTAFFIFVFYIALALGALAKAPVNFLHVGVAIGSYHLCVRRRLPGRWWHHAAGLGLMLAAGLPWPLYIIAHVKHAMGLWRYESVGEFADNAEKARPWWLYLTSMFQISLPWTPLWVMGVVGAIARYLMRRGRADSGGRDDSSTTDAPTHSADASAVSYERRSPRLFLRRDLRPLFPVVWFAATLAVLSFSNVKKNAYLLPAMPAMALSAAYGLVWLLAAARRARTRGQAESAFVAQILIGVGVGVALPIFIWKATAAAGASPPRVWIGLASVAAALALGAPPFLAWKRLGPRAWAAAQALVYAAATAALFNFATAPSENRRSARATCGVVATMLNDDPDLTILVPYLPEEASVYLPLGLRYDSAKPRVLVLFDDRKDLVREDRTWFEERIPGRRLTGVRRIDLSVPLAVERWKLFEMTFAPGHFAAAEAPTTTDVTSAAP